MGPVRVEREVDRIIANFQRDLGFTAPELYAEKFDELRAHVRSVLPREEAEPAGSQTSAWEVDAVAARVEQLARRIRDEVASVGDAQHMRRNRVRTMAINVIVGRRD